MALQNITEKQIVDRRSSETAIKDIVLLVNPSCAGCSAWEALIEGITSNYTNITFSKLEVNADNLPIFAPPVVPSIIALDNGFRSWEALGALRVTGPIEVMIDNWIAGNIDINTISGGESIIAI
jgi:hypothetical protein